jgi:hypothetical protein
MQAIAVLVVAERKIHPPQKQIGTKRRLSPETFAGAQPGELDSDAAEKPPPFWTWFVENPRPRSLRHPLALP